MTVTLHQAPLAKRPIIEHLLQLCLHDYSEFDGRWINALGLFDYDYLDAYWQESSRIPFLIHCDDQVAGFALVCQIDRLQDGPVHTIAEFFVLRAYRRQNVGRRAAWLLFDRFPGCWQVGQEGANRPAQAFWRTIIDAYTGGHFCERGRADWTGPLQEFDSHGGGDGKTLEPGRLDKSPE